MLPGLPKPEVARRAGAFALAALCAAMPGCGRSSPAASAARAETPAAQAAPDPAPAAPTAPAPDAPKAAADAGTSPAVASEPAKPPEADPKIPVGLQVGFRAPDFEAVDLEGKRFKLSDYRGKVVALDFWGFW